MAKKYDDEWLSGILNANQNKSFIKRVLRTDNYKPLDLGKGVTATHRMAYGEADGKFYVFPTVQMTAKGLKEFDSDTAWKQAHSSGNTIMFDDEKDAEWFSKNYKRYWEKPKGVTPESKARAKQLPAHRF